MRSLRVPYSAFGKSIRRACDDAVLLPLLKRILSRQRRSEKREVETPLGESLGARENIFHSISIGGNPYDYPRQGGYSHHTNDLLLLTNVKILLQTLDS